MSLFLSLSLCIYIYIYIYFYLYIYIYIYIYMHAPGSRALHHMLSGPGLYIHTYLFFIVGVVVRIQCSVRYEGPQQGFNIHSAVATITTTTK